MINMINGINDEVILAARLVLATLFLIFGCRKVRDYSGTVSQMVQVEAFYKDLSVMGGFLLLSITGAGKYSIDAL
jgi:uncharacterized membrane protein YphA (DoxX/SURF4 family)